MKIIFQVSRTPFCFAGVGRELSRTYAAEGIRGLFKGNGAQILRVCPYSGIQLLTFDVYCRALLSRGGRSCYNVGVDAADKDKDMQQHRSAAAQLSSIERVAAGAAAGATSVICTYPLDLLRARLAVMRETPEGAARFRGLFSAAREMVRQGGFASMYRGLTPTLFGILPYAGISYSTFEFLKERSRAHHGGAEPTTSARLIYGGISGFMGQASTYPLDIVRRRMQTEGYAPMHAHLEPAAAATATPPPPPGAFHRALLRLRWKEGGAVDTLTRVYGTEGIRGGLFKGLSLNAVKGPIAVGVSFTTYDLLKKAFGLEGGAGGAHGG